MFSLGIDSGSTMTKGVLFDGINVVGCHMLPTSMRPGPDSEGHLRPALHGGNRVRGEHRVWP